MIIRKMRNILLFALLLASQYLLAQGEVPEVNLLTPHNAIYSQLYYLQPDTYDARKASQCIPGPVGEAKERAAIQIKRVLDAKNLYVVISELPKEEAYQDSLGRARYYLFPKELPGMYLEREAGKWYYSYATLEVLPKLYQEAYPYGSAKLLDWFPRLGTGRFLGIMVWQYIGFGLFLLLAFLLYHLITRLLDALLPRIARSRFGHEYVDGKNIHQTAKYLSLVFLVSLFRLFLPVLQLPISMGSGIILVLEILRYTFLMLLALQGLEFLMLFANRWVNRTTTGMDNQLVIILRKGLQIAIVTFGIIVILNHLNVNVAALIAGVSIGGLALALAAQDSAKNLIGAFMIFLDRPFDVGDYIIAGNVEGVVQEVGFRSTRVQASDTSIVSIPNGKIANEVINNLGRRVYRRYRTEIGIKYNTPPDVIALFIEGVEELLRRHPETLYDKTEVHLRGFGASSLNIFMQTFFTVDSWSKELRGGQEVMLSVIRLAAELGVEFAFPSQSIYMETTPREIGDLETLRNRMQEILQKEYPEK